MCSKIIFLIVGVVYLDLCFSVQNNFYMTQGGTKIMSRSSSKAIDGMHTRSKLECISHCMKHSDCVSAQYNETAKYCRFHGDSPEYLATADSKTTAITLLGSCPISETHAIGKTCIHLSVQR